MATYKTDADGFLKAYIYQKERMSETYGVEYEKPNDETLQFLTCQQIYYNNVMVSRHSSLLVSVLSSLVQYHIV